MVERIEKRRAELQPQTLSKARFFEDGAIQVGAPRSPKDVAASVAVCVLKRSRPRGSRCVERSIEPVGQGGVRHLTRRQAVRTACPRVGDGRGKSRRERQSALQGQNPVDLPAPEYRIGERIPELEVSPFSERQVVN